MALCLRAGIDVRLAAIGDGPPPRSTGETLPPPAAEPAPEVEVCESRERCGGERMGASVMSFSLAGRGSADGFAAGATDGREERRVPPRLLGASRALAVFFHRNGYDGASIVVTEVRHEDEEGACYRDDLTVVFSGGELDGKQIAVELKEPKELFPGNGCDNWDFREWTGGFLEVRNLQWNC